MIFEQTSLKIAFTCPLEQISHNLSGERQITYGPMVTVPSSMSYWKLEAIESSENPETGLAVTWRDGGVNLTRKPGICTWYVWSSATFILNVRLRPDSHSFNIFRTCRPRSLLYSFSDIRVRIWFSKAPSRKIAPQQPPKRFSHFRSDSRFRNEQSRTCRFSTHC